MPNIKGTTPFTKLDRCRWKIPDKKLADEQFDQPGSIDLLFGGDLFYEILRPGKRTCPGNFPMLQETFLGWTLSGQTPAVTAPTDTQRIFLLQEDSNLKHDLNCFWEVEPMVQSTMTTEQTCGEHFLNTTQQPDGRFVVRLSVKMEPNQFGTSHLTAERRLHTIESRLERDPDLKVKYHKFMKEYEEFGHMEPVNFQRGKKRCYFLPRLPVFKERSSTTKTQIVFDSGA